MFNIEEALKAQGKDSWTVLEVGEKVLKQKNTGFVKYDDMEVRLSQSQALDYMPISEDDVEKAIDYLKQESINNQT